MSKNVTNGSKYSEYEVLKSLNKKRTIDVSESNKLITVHRTDKIGIKTKGKLDFLRNYCGWIVLGK